MTWCAVKCRRRGALRGVVSVGMIRLELHRTEMCFGALLKHFSAAHFMSYCFLLCSTCFCVITAGSRSGDARNYTHGSRIVSKSTIPVGT